jgi:hypothetical protein
LLSSSARKARPCVGGVIGGRARAGYRSDPNGLGFRLEGLSSPQYGRQDLPIAGRQIHSALKMCKGRQLNTELVYDFLRELTVSGRILKESHSEKLWMFLLIFCNEGRQLTNELRRDYGIVAIFVSASCNNDPSRWIICKSIDFAVQVIDFIGRRREIRTPDPLGVNEML